MGHSATAAKKQLPCNHFNICRIGPLDVWFINAVLDQIAFREGCPQQDDCNVKTEEHVDYFFFSNVFENTIQHVLN